MYRILRRRKLLRHRDRARPRTGRRPDEHAATGPRQVWSWDITYLRTPVKGRYWLLYMIVDVWSRKIVAARVHPNESDELASALIEEACLREGVSQRRAGHPQRQRTGDEGQDRPGHDAGPRHRALVQPAARQRRQPLLGGCSAP